MGRLLWDACRGALIGDRQLVLFWEEGVIVFQRCHSVTSTKGDLIADSINMALKRTGESGWCDSSRPLCLWIGAVFAMLLMSSLFAFRSRRRLLLGGSKGLLEPELWDIECVYYIMHRNLDTSMSSSLFMKIATPVEVAWYALTLVVFFPPAS